MKWVKISSIQWSAENDKVQYIAHKFNNGFWLFTVNKKTKSTIGNFKTFNTLEKAKDWAKSYSEGV